MHTCKNIIQLFLLTLFFVQCTDKVPRIEKPKKLLSKEKMATILEELVVVESSAQLQYVQLNKYHKLLSNTGDSILKSHHISRKVFEENMDYYGSRYEEMTEIYDSVKVKIIAQKKELEKKMDKLEE